MLKPLLTSLEITVFVFSLSFYSIVAHAQSSISQLPQTFTENFNGLPSSGSGDFSGLTTGWKIYSNGTETSSNSTSDGSSNSEGYYSYGTGTAADRALGCIDGATSNFEFGWIFENNSTDTIFKVYVSYVGEQWRKGATSNDQTIAFSYVIDNEITDFSSHSFISSATLNFASLVTCGLFGCSANSLDGNNANNRRNKVHLIKIPGGLLPGQDIAFKWTYPTPNNNNQSHGLAIDDLSISFFDQAWYLETGKTNLTDETAWTPFEDGTVITGTPTNQNFGEFVGDDQHFIIQRNTTLTNATWSSFYVEGTRSYIILDTGVTLSIQDENLEYSGELILRDSATLEVYFNDDDSFGPDVYDPVAFPGVRFASLGRESTVIYRPGFTYETTIPATNYFHLSLQTGDDFYEDSHDIILSGDYGIAGDFSYGYPVNLITHDPSDVPTFTFNGSDTSYINFPSYSGFGALPAITVNSGATLALGNLNDQTEYEELEHSRAITNNGTVYIETNKSLKLSSSLTNTGTFDIADDGSLVQTTSSTVSNSGIFNVTRKKPDGQANHLYNFWSTPVSSETFSDMSYSRAYQLNAPGTSTADWSSVSGASNMTVGRGYAMTGVNSHTFSGTINNGNISIPIESTGVNGNYNVFGNPYPSAICAADFVAANSSTIDGFINLFNHNENLEYTEANQQITINYTGSTVAGNTDGSSTLNNTFIGSCQGFYVKLNDGVYSGNVSFNNSMRKGTNQHFKTNAFDPVQAKFYLQLILGNTRYNTLFAVIDNTTRNYDRGWDAPAQSKNGLHISTRDVMNKDLCIQAIPYIKNGMRIPLNVNFPSIGNYSIHLSPTDKMELKNLNPYLVDTKTWEFWNLLAEDAELSIDESGLEVNRYILLFSPELSSTTSLAEYANTDLEDVSLLLNNGTLSFSGISTYEIESISVFDTQGKLIKRSENSTSELDVNPLSSGMYLVQIQTNNKQQKTFKITL